MESGEAGSTALSSITLLFFWLAGMVLDTPRYYQQYFHGLEESEPSKENNTVTRNRDREKKGILIPVEIDRQGEGTRSQVRRRKQQNQQRRKLKSEVGDLSHRLDGNSRIQLPHAPAPQKYNLHQQALLICLCCFIIV